MAITTLNDIVAGLAVSQKKRVIKNITACKAVGSMQSSWLSVGAPGAGVASPAYTAGTGYNCDLDTVGAIPYTNAAVQNYMAKLFATSAIAGTLQDLRPAVVLLGHAFAAWAPTPSPRPALCRHASPTTGWGASCTSSSSWRRVRQPGR